MKEYLKYGGLCMMLILFFGSVSILKAEDVCGFGHMRCTTSRKCIPMSWKCDTDNDCTENDIIDDSDELNCPAKTCADEEFTCNNNGQCIPERWMCDGEPDCENGEDESSKTCFQRTCSDDKFSCGDGNCIDLNHKCDWIEDCDNGLDEKNCTKTCEADMFTCNDGQCISHSWACDGDHDCLDESDEMDCGEKNCSAEQFKCESYSRCIDDSWKCDGDFDCPGHSDELSCDFTNPGVQEICSPESEFKCVTSGECIHKSWQCDGDPDCTDSSDESDKCVYSCRNDQFMCNNHVCISNVLRCDGNDDCIDRSDEQNCTKPCDKLGEFDCYGDGSRCIPNDRVCDGRNDCQHREDEDSALCKHKNPCLTVSATCTRDSHCVNKAYPNNTMDAQCVCNSGYNATEPGLCKDIDECDEADVCSQTCINTRGGYKCECHPGYQIEKHFFCRASGEQPWLYYANRRDIRRLRTDSRYMEIIVSETTNSIALDIDYEDGLMFWTDGGLEQIMRAEVDGDGVVATNQTTVITNAGNDGTAFSPDGLAVDWLYKKIYWTDTGSDTIRVANYRGDKMKTLVNTDLDDPRAISVDPENGYMYWTDWGHSPKIERSGMDGSNRQTIINGGDDLQWPNGLTIDYISKRIYWIDSKLHKIGVANMDGSKQGHILVDATEIRRPFSISVFEDSLYWTDWHTNSIRSVHKVTGRNAKTLSLGSYSVMDIKVYHELRQVKDFKEQATALCANAKCEFMCLPAARISSNYTVSCVCADNQMLNSDKRTCSTSPVTPTHTTKQPIITTGKPAETTEKPEETTTVPVPTSEEGMGGIAVITAGVVVIVLVILFTVGCLIFRRYQSKNKKSMNFDNPVYRKTTTSDDHCIIRNDEPHLEPLTANHETV